MPTRRTFLSITAQAAAAALLGCGDATAPSSVDASRLTFRTARGTSTVVKGLQPLGVAPAGGLVRDGVLYVPNSYSPSEALPLVILLHGSGSRGADWFGSFGARADAARVVMLAPDCRFVTWDAIGDGAFSDDVAFISTAITSVFNRCAVDSSRMAMFGFSDGASYALSLGLANGDLIPHVAAFSPGFVADAPRHGKPDFFVSHGTADPVLPIDQASRRIVPELRASGYTVEYTEFSGTHELPPDIASAAMDWLSKRF